MHISLPSRPGILDRLPGGGWLIFPGCTGDLGALWRLTLFTEVAEDVAVTWVNTLVLVAAGLPGAWALWQSLRGPLTGPPPE
ncbi:hypothetical protein ACIBQX_00090 [Nonomuraea sp. NPDC049714]|uniref:hypothetical protein n=1 Tax=Nonomuraea sp. NPDC049714 TaxID=3364357 RepID=UPI00378CAB41